MVFAIRFDQICEYPKMRIKFFHWNFRSIQFRNSEILLNKVVLNSFVSVSFSFYHWIMSHQNKCEWKKNSSKYICCSKWETKERTTYAITSVLSAFEYGKNACSNYVFFRQLYKRTIFSPEIKTSENPCYFSFSLSVFVFFHFFVPKKWLFTMVKHQNSLSRSLEAIVLASCFLKNKKKFTWTVRRLLTNLLQHILVELFWWLYAKCKYERKTRTTKKYLK